MKTEWIRTKSGGYMQIIVSDFSSHTPTEPTEAEQMMAAYRYMINKFAESASTWFYAMGRMAEAFSQYAETLEIIMDPEAMLAIREGSYESASGDSVDRGERGGDSVHPSVSE